MWVDVTASRSSAGRRCSARKTLLATLDKISRCASGIAVARPGYGDNFRLVRKVNDTELLVGARRFADNASPVRSEFVDFEMAPTFVDDLNSKIKAFEQAMADHSVSRSEHVATKKLIDHEMQSALEILAQLDPIVSNKLAGNHDLASQWENVRHIERAWISKKPESKPVANPAPTPVPVGVAPLCCSVAAPAADLPGFLGDRLRKRTWTICVSLRYPKVLHQLLLFPALFSCAYHEEGPTRRSPSQ
jgi:hypothetical protein